MTIEGFDNAEACLNKGGEEHRQIRFNGAITCYDKATKLSPDYAKAYNRRGVTKYTLGENEEAIKDLGKATVLNPNYTVAYVNRIAAEFELFNLDEAIEDIYKVIKLDSNITFGDFANRQNHATDGFHPEYAEAYIGRTIEKSRSINRYNLIEDRRKHRWELISETADGPIFALS